MQVSLSDKLPKVAAIVRKHLAFAGVTLNVQCAGRDLGVLLVGGAGRRASLQQSRLRSGRQRGQTHMQRHYVGCEVLGVAPTQLRRFRSQAAAATGITQAQRCATTAIEIGFGMDPALDVLRRQLVSFLSYAHRLYMAMAAVPGRIRVAWRAAKETHWAQELSGGPWLVDPLVLS